MEAVIYFISVIVVVASFYWIQYFYKKANIIKNKMRVSTSSGDKYQTDVAYLLGIAFACLHLIFIVVGVSAGVSGIPLQEILSASENFLYFLSIIAVVGLFPNWGERSRVGDKHRPIYFAFVFVYAVLALATGILFG